MQPNSDLASLHVSLPQGQREFVEAEAARTGCTTASEYVRRLIHGAQKDRAESLLEAKILEGVNSGAAREMTKKDWEELRAEFRRRVDARRKKS